jgi:hypothetical protein
VITQQRKRGLLAAFRNLPESEDTVADRPVKNLASVIEVCIERHRIGRETPEDVILREWVNIIGPEYAHRTRPQRISKAGVLVIQVDNPVLRRELQFHEDRIMTALRSLSACAHVRTIVFRN